MILLIIIIFLILYIIWRENFIVDVWRVNMECDCPYNSKWKQDYRTDGEWTAYDKYLAAQITGRGDQSNKRVYPKLSDAYYLRRNPNLDLNSIQSNLLPGIPWV